MKFSEELLKEFDLEPESEKEPVNVMQVKEILQFLKTCAERIERKSNLYTGSDDADEQMDCIDIVTVKLNDFAQAFRDLIIFIRKKEGTYRGSVSLRYCVSSYDTFDFRQTEKEKLFLKELLLRNEITHDYFNRELHQQKLVWIMEHCAEGALDVFRNINEYCIRADLMESYADNALKER